MGATRGRNYIYFFFRSVRVSSPTEASEHQVLENDVISDKHFRLLQHILIAWHSSKSQVLEEKKHTERQLLTSQTHLDHSESIEIPISWGKESCPKDIFECSDESKSIKIRLMTVRSKFRHVKLLKKLISNYALLLFDALSEIMSVRYKLRLNLIIFWIIFIIYSLISFLKSARILSRDAVNMRFLMRCEAEAFM
jgi:hypothetical protein